MDDVTWKEKYDEMCDVFLGRGIPEYMVGGLSRYVIFGIKPGGFLTSLLENDFMEAAGRADDKNLQCFREYAIVFYNDLSRECYGTPGAVGRWTHLGGLKGIAEKLQEEAETTD